MSLAFPLIDISGPPRERGRQYGRLAAERIFKGVSHYAAQIVKLGLLNQPKLAAIIATIFRSWRASTPRTSRKCAASPKAPGFPSRTWCC